MHLDQKIKRVVLEEDYWHRIGVVKPVVRHTRHGRTELLRDGPNQATVLVPGDIP
jgi:hypothetical protein